MSQNESFIEEVSEEVRRDRLFALMRKYGWIAVLAVVILVGGAAYNEWQKSNALAKARDLGDSIVSALDIEDRTKSILALQSVQYDGDGQAIVKLLIADEAQRGGDTSAAAKVYRQMISNAAFSKPYQDLAAFKLILLEGADMGADERTKILADLARPGAAFRLLAEEQLVLIDIENGDKDAALDRLNAIVADVDVTRDLRNRASLMIVALGGKIEAS